MATLIRTKINKIISVLRTKLSASQKNGFVVNVSGGVDSAVVIRIVQLAVPNDKVVVGLFLPILLNENDTFCIDALRERFKLPITTIPLSNVMNTINNHFSEQLKQHSEQLQQSTIGNGAARLRMLYAYFYSNLMNLLVIGTTNYDEYILGYGTKFGDCASDFNPIIALTKSEIFAIARELKIPQIIIAKPPSAGLWDGQTDEGELGFTYNDLAKYHRGGLLPLSITNKIVKQIATNRHKETTIECTMLTALNKNQN